MAYRTGFANNFLGPAHSPGARYSTISVRSKTTESVHPEEPRGGDHVERIAIFIDGANMFYAQRKIGWHIDYKKVYDFYAKQAQVYNAFYYTSVTNPLDPGMEGFLRALTGMGYTVRRKTVKEIADQESGQIIRKANLDIEIVIDMLTTADLYDRAALISGDGDFERAVEYLRGRGKRIEGLGVRSMAAYDLVNAMDQYLYLEDYRDEMEKSSSSSSGIGDPDEPQDILTLSPSSPDTSRLEPSAALARVHEGTPVRRAFTARPHRVPPRSDAVIVPPEAPGIPRQIP